MKSVICETIRNLRWQRKHDIRRFLHEKQQLHPKPTTVRLKSTFFALWYSSLCSSSFSKSSKYDECQTFIMTATFLTIMTSVASSNVCACDKQHENKKYTNHNDDDGVAHKHQEKIKLQQKEDNEPIRFPHDDEYFANPNFFSKKEMWKPKIEYPLWDPNWDNRQELMMQSIGQHNPHQHICQLQKTGITRHIILIRHGQYNEQFKEDSKRNLTPLGQVQAHYTGKRLADLLNKKDNSDPARFTPIAIQSLHVSDMQRAKETADIISFYLPQTIERTAPNPDLNEGLPALAVPRGIPKVEEDHLRIERAFKRYFYRELLLPSQQQNDNQCSTKVISSSSTTASNDQQLLEQEKHKFEIIVCHGNVIRYFLCRALQLPPEAWLRWSTYNCSITYLTIQPTGTVSCRMIGDIGHLPFTACTFSMNHGFNWI